MYNADKYRFTLIRTGADNLRVYPHYKGDSLFVEEPEDGEVFFRKKLSGALIFHRAEADLLTGLSIETECVITIHNLDGGSLEFTGYFSKIDAEIDEDNRTYTVEPIARDAYEKILAGMDKEFDLIELNPTLSTVTVRKQPIIQVYIPMTNFLTNIIDGFHFEQFVPVPIAPNFPVANNLVDNYHFTAATTKYFIPGDAAALVPDVSGTYSVATNTREDGKYQFNYNGSTWDILDLDNSSAVVYQGGTALIAGEVSGTPNPFKLDASSDNYIFNSVATSSQCHVFSLPIYGRILTNETEIDGTPTSEIPAEDIVPDNNNYKYALGVDLTSNIQYFSGHSAAPTPFSTYNTEALNFSGEYFTRLPGSVQTYPVARSEWRSFSLWFSYDTALRTLQEDGSQDIELRFCYRLHDVLKALLTVIDPDLQFDDTGEYSDFFYGKHPVREISAEPVITAKSNVLIGDYDKPAQKAPIRLAQVFELLWNFHKVKWHNESSKLRLEHIRYYRNGKHYTTPNIETDLTTVFEGKTGKNWAFRTKKYSYDKPAIPERIETHWMDPASKPFEGYPINCLSTYAEKGKVEDRRIGVFSADIDLALTQPEDFSKDGFFFFEAFTEGAVLRPKLLEIEIDGIEYNIQNGHATLVYAHDKYHRDELPTSSVNLNNQDITATSVKRTKIQEIQFPDIAINTMQLITTSLGTGRLRSRETKLDDRNGTIIVEHDTE